MTTIAYIGAPEGYEALAEVCDGLAEAVHVKADAEALGSALAGADALLDASMKVAINDAMIEAAPKLKIISCATTGSDHISRTALDARAAPVRTLREDPELLRNITPAAELSWALVLACARKLPAAVGHTRGGGWDREQFPGLMLNGRQLGLVGCGRIGGWMSRYAAAFGMDVVGYDPVIDPWPEGILQVGLEEVFETSDVISVHVHLSPETRGMLNADLFGRVKPGAIFINTSRGGLADERAILQALTSGRLAAAGLDVLDGEPDVANHPLRLYAETHDNLLITPHCGGFSPDAVRVVCRRAGEKILDHLGLVR